MTVPPVLRILLAAALCCLLACPARADDPWKPKPVCIFGMPYLGEAVKKDQKGIIITLLNAVFEPEGIVLKHMPIPYRRAVEEVEQGKIQCTLDVKNNNKRVVQGNHTLLFYDLTAARLQTTEWKGLSSLKNKRVAYMHGFGIETFLPVNFLPHQVYDLSSAFDLLEREEVAFVLDDSRMLKYAIYDSKLPSYLFVFDPIKSFPVHPIFAPTPEGRYFRDIYDRRMKALAASGELAHILEKTGLSKPRIQRILKAQ